MGRKGNQACLALSDFPGHLGRMELWVPREPKEKIWSNSSQGKETVGLLEKLANREKKEVLLKY